MNPKKLVKIFHCVFLSGWGGVEKLFQYYSDFNRENPDNSIENIVYSPSPINPEYRIIFETFSGRSFKDVVRLARAIISGEDVVHFHNNYANAKVSSLLKYLPAKSIILEEQGTVWNNSRRFQ